MKFVFKKILIVSLLVSYFFTINVAYSFGDYSNNDLESINLIMGDEALFEERLDAIIETMPQKEHLDFFKNLVSLNLSGEQRELLKIKIEDIEEAPEEQRSIMPEIEKTKETMTWEIIQAISKLPADINPQLIAEFIQEEIKKVNQSKNSNMIQKHTEKAINLKDIKTVELLVQENKELMAVINLIRYIHLYYAKFQEDKVIDHNSYLKGIYNNINWNMPNLREWLRKAKSEEIQDFKILLPHISSSTPLREELLNMTTPELLFIFNGLVKAIQTEILTNNNYKTQKAYIHTLFNLKNNIPKSMKQMINNALFIIAQEKIVELDLDIFRIIKKYDLADQEAYNIEEDDYPKISTKILSSDIPIEHISNDMKIFLSLKHPLPSAFEALIKTGKSLILTQQDKIKLIILRALLSRERFEKIVVDIVNNTQESEFHKDLKNIKIIDLLTQPSSILIIEETIKEFKDYLERIASPAYIEDPGITDGIYIRCLKNMDALCDGRQDAITIIAQYKDSLREKLFNFEEHMEERQKREEDIKDPIILYYSIYAFMYLFRFGYPKDAMSAALKINLDITETNSKKNIILKMLEHKKIKKHNFIVLALAEWFLKKADPSEESCKNPDYKNLLPLQIIHEELSIKLINLKIPKSLHKQIHRMSLRQMAHNNNISALKHILGYIIDTMIEDLKANPKTLGTHQIQKENWLLIKFLLELNKTREHKLTACFLAKLTHLYETNIKDKLLQLLEKNVLKYGNIRGYVLSYLLTKVNDIPDLYFLSDNKIIKKEIIESLFINFSIYLNPPFMRYSKLPLPPRGHIYNLYTEIAVRTNDLTTLELLHKEYSIKDDKISRMRYNEPPFTTSFPYLDLILHAIEWNRLKLARILITKANVLHSSRWVLSIVQSSSINALRRIFRPEWTPNVYDNYTTKPIYELCRKYIFPIPRKNYSASIFTSYLLKQFLHDHDSFFMSDYHEYSSLYLLDKPTDTIIANNLKNILSYNNIYSYIKKQSSDKYKNYREVLDMIEHLILKEIVDTNIENHKLTVNDIVNRKENKDIKTLLIYAKQNNILSEHKKKKKKKRSHTIKTIYYSNTAIVQETWHNSKLIEKKLLRYPNNIVDLFELSAKDKIILETEKLKKKAKKKAKRTLTKIVTGLKKILVKKKLSTKRLGSERLDTISTDTISAEIIQPYMIILWTIASEIKCLKTREEAIAALYNLQDTFPSMLTAS